MEVAVHEWMSKAMSNINAFFLSRGDDDQYLEGNFLRNTIGFAMGLPVRLPRSESEQEKAAIREFCFYSRKSFKAIEIVRRKLCKYAPKRLVCIIPIEIYHKQKLYEIPVYRFLDKDDVYRFLDNCGRYYSSFDDYLNHNKLPKGLMLYPENGHLTASSQDPKIAKTAFGNTPANMPSVKMLQMGDTIAGLAGTASSIAWYVASNWFIITVFTITAVWAILRGLYTLYERIKHRDSLNPFRHTEVWVLWIGLAMCCFSDTAVKSNVSRLVWLEAMGPSMRLTGRASKGQDIANAFEIIVQSINGTTSMLVNTDALCNDIYSLIDDIEQMSDVDIALQSIALAFWDKGPYTYFTKETLCQQAHNLVLEYHTSKIPEAQRQDVQRYRNETLRNDVLLLRFMRNSNVTHASAALAIVSDLAREGVLFEILDIGKVRSMVNGVEFNMGVLESLPATSRVTILSTVYRSESIIDISFVNPRAATSISAVISDDMVDRSVTESEIAMPERPKSIEQTEF